MGALLRRYATGKMVQGIHCLFFAKVKPILMVVVGGVLTGRCSWLSRTSPSPAQHKRELIISARQFGGQCRRNIANIDVEKTRSRN